MERERVLDAHPFPAIILVLAIVAAAGASLRNPVLVLIVLL
jgi:hypothetical protein